MHLKDLENSNCQQSTIMKYQGQGDVARFARIVNSREGLVGEWTFTLTAIASPVNETNTST